MTELEQKRAERARADDTRFQNCWEFKRCGREPGGARAGDLGVCPAAVASDLDGINGGRLGGRACWTVAGTLCGGQVRGTFAQKLLACSNCDFLQRVEQEMGASFQLLPLGHRLVDVIRAEEDRHRSFFDGLPVGLFRCSPAGRFLDVNQALVELLGRPGRTSLLGRTMNRLAVDPEAIAQRAEVLRRDGQLHDFELRLRRGDGTVFWARESSHLVVDETGRPLYQEGIIQDITERKRAEEEARARDVAVAASEAQLAERKRTEEAASFLAEASKVLAGSLDYLATLSQVAGLAVPRLADWCVIELVGDDGCLRPQVACANPEQGDWAASWRDASCAREEGLCMRVLRSGQAEVLNDVSDEELVAAACNPEQLAALRRIAPRSILAVPLRTPAESLGVLTLISAESRRRYEQADLALAEEVGRRAALAISNAGHYEAAQRAIHAREEILALVSHDLRNSLGVIRLSAEVISGLPLSGAAGDRQADKVGRIQRAVRQMETLIRDLLDAAAIEAGRLAVEPALLEVPLLVDEAVQLMQPVAFEKSLRLEAHLDGELPPILADRGRLLQVFSNLVGNAIKFTVAGGDIRIGARATADELLFDVDDTGPGIAEEALPHVFDRYWQASHARRSGAGLGLYIVKGIVEAHGGRVWVESRLGVGSTFRFSVPSRRP